MTVDNELIKIGDSIFKNRADRLWLPEYVMPEHINTEMPTEADLVTESETQLFPIGAQLRKDCKLFRYCKAGAAISNVGFLKGNYTQCPGKAGNSVGAGFEGAMYAEAVAGATSFTIADTAATKNLYAGAYLVIYDDTNDKYHDYLVIGNDASTGVYTTLYIAPPGFKVTVTTSYGITVYLSEYMNIRNMAAGGGWQSAFGYAKHDITSAYFFWLQTAGRISGVTGATTWPGQTQYYRDVYCNTDGSLIGYTAGYQRVGYLLARTATDYGDNLIMLQLDQ